MSVFQVNTYLLACEETGAVVVVDPGDGAEVVVSRLDELGVSPELILNTHGHLDHVAGNSIVKARFDVPILMHPDDLFLVEAFGRTAARYGLDWAAPPAPDGELTPGQDVVFGSVRLDVRHAPGHSPGHVVFTDGREAIVGDVLFNGSIGRTDLERGDLATLLRSIDEALLPLDDDVVVHSGHGPPTTIGHERKTNPYLQPDFRDHALGEA